MGPIEDSLCCLNNISTFNPFIYMSQLEQCVVIYRKENNLSNDNEIFLTYTKILVSVAFTRF